MRRALVRGLKFELLVHSLNVKSGKCWEERMPKCLKVRIVHERGQDWDIRGSINEFVNSIFDKTTWDIARDELTVRDKLNNRG